MDPITREELFMAKAAGQAVEVPKPVTRQEIFLDAIAKKVAELGKGGGGGVSSQIVELMPETQFVYDENFGIFAAQTEFELTIGRTYIVNWNGVEYITTAKFGVLTMGDMSASAVYVGNPVVAGGEDNGLTFMVAQIPYITDMKYYTAAVPLDGSTEISVSIKGGEIAALYKSPYEPLVLNARIDNSGSMAVIYGDDTEVINAFFSGREIVVILMGNFPNRLTVHTCVPYFLRGDEGGTVLIMHGGISNAIAQVVYNGDGTYVPYSE